MHDGAAWPYNFPLLNRVLAADVCCWVKEEQRWLWSVEWKGRGERGSVASTAGGDVATEGKAVAVKSRWKVEGTFRDLSLKKAAGERSKRLIVRNAKGIGVE